MTRYFYDPRLTDNEWKPGIQYFVTIYKWQWWYRFKWWYKYPVPVVSVTGTDYKKVIKRVKSIIESYKNGK